MITFNQLGYHGRFGNQMFQYATLYSVAKTKGYMFGVPLHTNHSDNAYRNFCLDECFALQGASFNVTSFPLHAYREKTFDYDTSIFGIPDNTDIIGYFQSEKYFKAYRKQLLNEEFVFHDDFKDTAMHFREQYPVSCVSLHMRLGDYEGQEDKHPVCSLDYYAEALDSIPVTLPVMVFSDDLPKAKRILDKLDQHPHGGFIYPETHGNPYVDMCLMSMCDYHIIANSSFSWWGAWLSNSKQVIAPSKWFGGHPSVPQQWSDIYAEGWIII